MAFLRPLVVMLVALLKVAIVCLVLLLARGCLWLFNLLVVLPPFDPLRKISGPKAGALQTHLQDVLNPNKSHATHEDWKSKYGKTFRFHGFGKHDYRLMSFDFRAISHILNSPTYEKPWQTRALLSRLIGRGIFSMEGSEHKVQRRLIGPAFSQQAVQTMIPIFLRKAQQLCDRWDRLIPDHFSAGDSYPSDPPPAYDAVANAVEEKFTGATIDVAQWISRASFDVIGLSGFDYNFNALDDETENVYQAFRRMFDVFDKGPGLRSIFELYFPIIRTISPDYRTKVTNESLQVIDKAGEKLIAAKKAAVLAETSGPESSQKDILSLLIKANLSTDLSKRLTDKELLDQCSTFLLAGSDSVSLALSWCFHFLSLNAEIQTRLRDEIFSIIHDNASLVNDDEHFIDPLTPNKESFRSSFSPPPTYRSATHESVCDSWNKIEASPLLDAVVRETLRLCPPVHSTIRVAMADDEIPVSHPVVLQDSTIVEKGGSISIRKGSYIHIPIEGLNLSTDIWGSNALEFDPDRWSSLPSAARSANFPGLGNLMTFGMGPHSCLGYKFTINEMKAFIATILPQFIFRPAASISKYNSILTRPYVTNKWELGTQLPLLVERYPSAA
ncbi:hypothetical protein H0H92_007441 [Tricholoma furcatifolium]|nr:hypothetical protein H0H92_007441 [Tricholoma furcatifolium]